MLTRDMATSLLPRGSILFIAHACTLAGHFPGKLHAVLKMHHAASIIATELIFRLNIDRGDFVFLSTNALAMCEA
jgi:hypothetical protein